MKPRYLPVLLALAALACAQEAPSPPPEAPGAEGLEALTEHLIRCAEGNEEPAGCTGVVYVRSERMPLSLTGLDEVSAAAVSLGVEVTVIEDHALTGARASPAADSLAREMLEAGASLHAPALLVYRAGRLEGSALLGYKSRDAWASLLAERLRPAEASEASEASPSTGAREPPFPEPAPASLTWRDYPVPGTPGAYFRWVPGRDAVAYEAAGQVQLLWLESGERSPAPGHVDFVPTPDGRLFVTPGRSGTLEFYDAEEVFAASAQGRGREVRPFHSDPEMRDQYPSVGILGSAGEGAVTYRVLTSWFDRVAFRDYEARRVDGRWQVRALGPVVPACPGLAFSIPIMAPDGREVAGRDERAGTTKIFRLADDGGCTEAEDLALPTGKVAWDAAGRRLAFAIPQGAVRDGSGVLWRGDDDPSRVGVFLFDRRSGGARRVEASEEARRLTFPEFVGGDRLLFLLPPERPGGPSRFRLVCCLP